MGQMLRHQVARYNNLDGELARSDRRRVAMPPVTHGQKIARADRGARGVCCILRA